MMPVLRRSKQSFYPCLLLNPPMREGPQKNSLRNARKSKMNTTQLPPEAVWQLASLIQRNHTIFLYAQGFHSLTAYMQHQVFLRH